jgi:L-2-hydroxyglutarate oxidase LhgO
MAAATTSDVLIVGGGLAGLTLALQLLERCPQLSIRVFERRNGPAPAAGPGLTAWVPPRQAMC